MKKLFYATVLFVLMGCKNNSNTSLESFQTITDIFDKSEIEDLNIILNFFNAQICSIENKTNITDCYRNFFKRLEASLEEGYLDLRISFQDQQEMYNQISQNTFNQIWTFNKSWHWGSSDTLKSIDLKSGSTKYKAFLESFGKENNTISDYNKWFTMRGGISRDVLWDYKRYDIRDPRIQLVVAIHYLTINDEFEREEKWQCTLLSRCCKESK